ncbi:MAG TPA: hypothetical protein PKC76_03995 [Saprospiraceae bacterium]|nr:hypothetical protein [Saprospiraceae bacterium]
MKKFLKITLFVLAVLGISTIFTMQSANAGVCTFCKVSSDATQNTGHCGESQNGTGDICFNNGEGPACSSNGSQECVDDQDREG